MIRLARAIDGEARKLRTRYEDEVEEVERSGLCEDRRRAVQDAGPEHRPRRDVQPCGWHSASSRATRGWRGGALHHNVRAAPSSRAETQAHREPFVLPQALGARGRNKLDLSAPFNFVSTADTIGGNSGSPVLNRAGEFVGINFDRNRHGLVRNFVYTEEQARHISVHSRGILDALRRLYDVEPLLSELTSSR